MFSRLRDFSRDHSFFLFGPRGSGKSTLVLDRFDPALTARFDLLDSQVAEQFFRDPGSIYAIVKALPEKVTHIIIDEIQKVPKLLDEVHRLIEEKNKKQFVLTGSSARKLRRGGANLLAGRAFVYHLYALSCFELKEKFDLNSALHWGTLPKIFSLDANDKEAFLRAYAETYLKEEIWDEQIVRKLPSFRRFLEVAAQCNGKIINYSNIAKDVGVDAKTVKEYFVVLEDTLIGFFLEPYHSSFRKRLAEKPKFYFFDTGVSRSLSRQLTVPLLAETSAYGDAFEHFVILEFIRLASYFQPDYRFSYIRTAGDVEVDLVVERPGKPLLCVEIKSSIFIDESKIGSFKRLTKDIPNCEAIVLSQDRFMKRYDHVTCYPWKQGLEECCPV